MKSRGPNSSHVKELFNNILSRLLFNTFSRGMAHIGPSPFPAKYLKTLCTANVSKYLCEDIFVPERILANIRGLFVAIRWVL